MWSVLMDAWCCLRLQIRKYKVVKTPLSVYKSIAGREKYR